MFRRLPVPRHATALFPTLLLSRPAPPSLYCLSCTMSAIVSPFSRSSRLASWRTGGHVLAAALLLLLLTSRSSLAFRAKAACRWEGEKLHFQQLDREGNRNTNATCSNDISKERSSSRESFLHDHVLSLGGMLVSTSLNPQPAKALFEDFKKEGRCPAYKAVDDFEIDKYMGIWYELAYHDWTQIKICGCTRFNMTRIGDRIKDAFTTKCPYEADAGETFLINMREVVDNRTPGSFKEYAFYNKWDNKVVALWRSGEEQRYERAIQLQCVEVLGRRAFVGINFLSREPIISSRDMAEMFQEARALGLAGIGGSPAEMELVRHEGCRYPSSSGNRESRSWGSAWGVNTVAL